VSEQLFGFKLLQLLQRHSDQRARVTREIGFGGPIRKDATEAMLRVVAVAGETQDAV
jgi:hypothetical protein